MCISVYRPVQILQDEGWRHTLRRGKRPVIRDTVRRPRAAGMEDGRAVQHERAAGCEPGSTGGGNRGDQHGADDAGVARRVRGQGDAVRGSQRRTDNAEP